MAGTVFAKSLADDQTGFALTDGGATESLLRQAPSLSSPGLDRNLRRLTAPGTGRGRRIRHPVESRLRTARPAG